jgi:hypothetical protein
VFLLHVIKGIVSGEVIVPSEDVCRLTRYGVLGFVQNVLIFCKVRDVMKATIYNMMASNETGQVRFILKRGVKIRAKKSPQLFIKDIYSISFADKLHVVAYRKENSYRPVKHWMKQNPSAGYKQARLSYNILRGLIYMFCSPGPQAIAMKEIYNPREGILKNGSGKMEFQEKMASFHPHSTDYKVLPFYFNPPDGSLLHIRLRTRPKERDNILRRRPMSVDIYNIG